MYNDKMLIILNYKDGEICVDFDEINEKLNSTANKNPDNFNSYQGSPLFALGDPYENRTRVTAVKGRCLKPLDQRAFLYLFCGIFGSGSRI